MSRRSGEGVVPPSAKYAVRCDASNTGKHIPTTKETVSEGKHIKYKVCTQCHCTLK